MAFQRTDDSGFTLVEAMATVAVLALLAATGMPALREFALRQRTGAAIDLLVGHLAEARLAAVVRNRAVVACPPARTGGCAGHGDWSAGWSVFLDDGDLLRSVRLPADRGLRIRTSEGRPRVRYLPDGRSAGSNVTFQLCDEERRLLATVVVNNAGRPRAERAGAGEACPD